MTSASRRFFVNSETAPAERGVENAAELPQCVQFANVKRGIIQSCVEHELDFGSFL